MIRKFKKVKNEKKKNFSAFLWKFLGYGKNDLYKSCRVFQNLQLLFITNFLFNVNFSRKLHENDHYFIHSPKTTLYHS